MKRILIASVFVLLLVVAGLYMYERYNPFTYYDDKVHVHSDFVIIINDQKIDLTAEKYQSSAESIRHKNVHLHDGDDTVVHRHADGITFAEFLGSLNFTLNDQCLRNDNGEEYCTDKTNTLVLFVNGEVEEDIDMYIPQEEDRILLYYGPKDNPHLNDYLESVTDEACIFSGTCPERGVAPPESCGLTCEI
ncbi:MAG TPA: hypothetical protein VGE31_01465 [Candidatus Paceibacterota bacterium]